MPTTLSTLFFFFFLSKRKTAKTSIYSLLYKLPTQKTSMGILILPILIIFLIFSLSLILLSQPAASLLRNFLMTWAPSLPPLFQTLTHKEAKDHDLMGDQYKCTKTTKSGEKVECVVCLCTIEEGEEIKELKCQHLFHMDCLNRWLALDRHPRCPLCRGSLRAAEQEQVLFFPFSSFQTSSVHNTWWLRWFTG